MFATGATRTSVTTNDGVTLSCLEAGEGRPVVMIPGWSQTALQWCHQIEALSRTHHVIAVDMRGHGESEKPDFGYKISRLAQDVRDLIIARDLNDVTLIGHSMGCSVIWGLYDLYGADRLDRLVLVDQPAFLAQTPLLTTEEQAQAGAIFPPDGVVGLVEALRGEDPAGATTGFIGSMFTKGADRKVIEETVRLNLMLPRTHATTLVFNHVFSDWRDVIRRISVPTLCIGGEASLVPPSTVRWQASVIEGARCEIFGAEEGGSHFMFIENPAKFNALLADFLAS